MSRVRTRNTVTEQAREIAPPREKLTTRAGRSLGDIYDELGCSLRDVNALVRSWSEELLAASTDRIAQTEVPGLDEHLIQRRGRFGSKAWATGIVGVGRAQLPNIP